MENIIEEWELMLKARIDALGVNASEEQGQSLVSWIIQEVPMDYWNWAAEEAIGIPGVYTEIRMRLSEMRGY